MLLLIAGYRLSTRQEATSRLSSPISLTSVEKEIEVNVTVYLIEEGSDQLVSKVIQIPDRRGHLQDWVLVILNALSPAMPKVRAVFLSDGGTLYLDFEGGSLEPQDTSVAEGMLRVESIVRTLAGVVEGTKQVKFLEGGADVESLFGHVYARKPFAVPSSQ